MRVRSLCALLLLALVALPAWSAPEPVSQITLADILTPAPAETGALPDIFEAAACIPSCTSNAQCQSLCCATAVCTFSSACQKKVCNCTVCP